MSNTGHRGLASEDATPGPGSYFFPPNTQLAVGFGTPPPIFGNRSSRVKAGTVWGSALASVSCRTASALVIDAVSQDRTPPTQRWSEATPPKRRPGTTFDFRAKGAKKLHRTELSERELHCRWWRWWSGGGRHWRCAVSRTGDWPEESECSLAR